MGIHIWGTTRDEIFIGCSLWGWFYCAESLKLLSKWTSDVVPAVTFNLQWIQSWSCIPAMKGFWSPLTLWCLLCLDLQLLHVRDSVEWGRCKRALHNFRKHWIHWLWVCAAAHRAASLQEHWTHHLLQVWTLLLVVLIYKNEVAPNDTFCNQLAHDMFWDDLLLFFPKNPLGGIQTSMTILSRVLIQMNFLGNHVI